MFKKLKKLDEHVQSIGNRYQAYVGYAAMLIAAWIAMSGLLKWGRPFFPEAWGWPEAIVLAMAALCALVLVASAALIAWRFFKPLQQKSTAAPASTAIWKPHGLYVGQMYANFAKLESDLYLEFAGRLFNATGGAIDVRYESGVIECQVEGSTTTEELSSIQFGLNGRKIENISNLQEFLFVIGIHVRRELADLINKQIAGGERQLFRFDKFNLVAFYHDDPARQARVPLWSPIEVYWDGRRYQAGIVIEGRGQFKASPAVISQ